MSAQSPVADVSVAIQPLAYPPDQGARFQIVVANAGPDAVQGVWLFHEFPVGLGPAQWSNGNDSGQGDLNQHINLAAGQSLVYTITSSPPGDHLIQEFVAYATISVPDGTTDPTPGDNTAIYTQGLQVQAANSSAYEGSTAPVTLATFNYGQNSLPPSAFNATIAWGDGTTSAADIAVGQNGYYVEGSHAYAEVGTYQTKITFNTTNGPRTYFSWMRVHNSPMSGPDPSGSQHFIQEVYDDVLHRDPDAAGMGYWISRLSAGMDRRALAQALLNSEEYAAIEVRAAFQQFLHRDADAGATAYFASMLTRGMSAKQLDEVLISSPEYWQARAGGNNAGFLNALWADALDRSEIDPEALAYFESILSHGGTRAQVAQIVFGSLEFAQDTVEAIYMQYLNRPSGGDLPAVQFLQNGGSANALAAGLIASTEYFVLANG